MHSITFYPLGNADSYQVVLANGQRILFDYANVRGTDANDKRLDLNATLRADLKDARRDYFDVVAFTHADRDHVQGASQFFHLLHSTTYQGDGRIKINELWVPAAFITESATELCDDAKILQKEARYRLLNKQSSVRVFSRPELLHDWLEENDSSAEICQDCLVDAGKLIPTFTEEAHGVEFFVHSPFATYQDNGMLVERNDCSIVLQATFFVDNTETRLILAADTTHDVLTEIVDITRHHKSDERLAWDIIKLPHHCSYLSLSDTRGTEQTVPVENARWIYEDQAGAGAIVVSTSKAVPSRDPETDNDPPHRQAANYYRDCVEAKNGEFVVTMEHPTEAEPKPLVITIDRRGATIKKATRSGISSIISQPSPRMG